MRPAVPHLSGSGLPISSNGDRSVRRMSVLIRLSVRLSCVCQYRIDVPCVVRPMQHGLVLPELVRGGTTAADLIHAALDLLFRSCRVGM